MRYLNSNQMLIQSVVFAIDKKNDSTNITIHWNNNIISGYKTINIKIIFRKDQI